MLKFAQEAKDALVYLPKSLQGRYMIIAFASSKGGLGKSTAAAHPALACELATRSVVCLAWRLRSAMAEAGCSAITIIARHPC